MELKINHADKLIGILNQIADAAEQRQPLMRALAGTMRREVPDF